MMATTQLDLASLLSADNGTRNAAEQALDALQTSQPQLVVSQLCGTLADGAADPTARTLCAILLRRRLPSMLPSLSEEWRGSVKAKLLEALSSPCDRSLRTKVCDTVGRLGIEFHAEGRWPELMQFIQHSCSAGEPTAHEAALSVLSHMAPALVDPAGWAAIGAQLQGLLLAALSDGMPPQVGATALEALAALLTALAAQEEAAETSAERKKLKAVANDLQNALPAMLRALETAVGAADQQRVSDVLAQLSSVAACQPRLFKGVLPAVVEGLAQLASGSLLEADARIACAEMLITLAEGAPKMCAKLDTFTPRVLGSLLPMLLRLNGELDEWEAAMPTDALRDDDDDDDDEKEAAYAAEALERLCEAVSGEAVARLMLPQLEPMLSPSAPWASRHAALVAIATVCEHGASVIEPHLTQIVGMLTGAMGAPEARLRWAACYALALLCDEFPPLPEKMHEQLAPLLVTAMADASARVRAAACLATVNLVQGMEEAALLEHAQGLLGALHTIVSASGGPNYVAFAACSALAVVCAGLEDAPNSPMGSAYAAFMPHLAARLGPAVSVRYGKYAGMLLACLGNLTAASGSAVVAADAPNLIASIAGLLAQTEVLEDRELLKATHCALTKLAAVTPGAFVGAFEQLLPNLLVGAQIEVDIQIERVEVADEDEDEGWETKYIDNKGKGLMRLRINSNQMDEKLMALDSLFSYARALGASFYPAVAPLVAACLPTLSYKWNQTARASAATALAEAYKCVVLAAATGEGGVTKAHAAELLQTVLTPLTEALNKEDALDAADAQLDAIKEVLVLERTHQVGALTGHAALQGVIQLVKRQLQLDEKRAKAKAAAAAERDDDDEGDDDEEEEAELEGELLTTCSHVIIELLTQHGAQAVAPIEAQLLPHVQPWLLGGDATRLALGFETLAAIIAHAGKEHAKKYVTAALPLYGEHAAAEEPRLRRAALCGLGAVAEHGGKLLTRNAAVDLAARLVATLDAPDARYAANVEASEAAAATLGRMLVHRPQAFADVSTVLPTWLSWMPLRYNEDDARTAMRSLCHLLEADAQAILGTDGARFPAVLAAITAAYEAEATGADVSTRLKSLVQSWNAANGELLRSTAAAMPPVQQEKLGRLVA